MIYSFVARDAGLFQKHGIDPKLVVFDSGSGAGPSCPGR